MAAIIALLVLNFVDEQFNDGRYSNATRNMLEKVTRSFG